VIGYRIFMNDGLDGDLTTEVHGLNNYAPEIQSYVISMATSVIGRTYKFKVIAENYSGTISSSALTVAFASLPSKPLNPPISNPNITD